MTIAQAKTSAALRCCLLAAAGAASLIALPVATASAQTRAVSSEGAANGYYYTLPNVVRIRPGTMRILHGRCDSSYPMDEFLPCGDATGGPVGGRGS